VSQEGQFPQEEQPQQPQQAQFADIENFASAQELQQAAGDPQRLFSLIQERVQRLHEGYSNEVEQANHWRTLTSDEGMRQHILAYGQQQSQSSNGRRTQPQPQDSELAQLRRDIQSLKQERASETKAQRDMREFAAAHPDLGNYVNEMQRILTKHPGTSLALAYEHARMVSNNTPRMNRPPVSEQHGGGSPPSGLNEQIASLQASLQDRGKFKTTEDAARHAVLKLQNLIG
jgi:hypothetical protein